MDTTVSQAGPSSEITAAAPQTGPAPSHLPKFTLPDEPLVTIEPITSWAIVDFSALWVFRELLYFLIWRDLKVRYKQTLLGVAWVVMQPLLMTLVFSVFLGMLARVPTGGIPYPLVVYTGLLPWTFFSTAVIGCSNSLVGNANLITKVYFPRILIPAASVGARVVDLLISFAILVSLMLYYRFVLHYHIELTRNLAALPLLIGLLTLLALGVGLLTSSLNVKYRDVGVALPVALQLGMFVSPVIYSVVPLVPEKWRTLYFLNPLAGLIEGFRSAMLGGKFNYFGLAVSACFAVTSLLVGAYVFRRVEKSFADLI
jgi:lipopolysaccharide transport system permease protein